MTKNNIVIFPKFRRSEVSTIEEEGDISLLSHHYAEQFLASVQNHGIIPNESFFADLIFLQETMAAILKRNRGMHHSIQDIIDDQYIPEIDGDVDVEEDDGA